MFYTCYYRHNSLSLQIIYEKSDFILRNFERYSPHYLQGEQAYVPITTAMYIGGGITENFDKFKDFLVARTQPEKREFRPASYVQLLDAEDITIVDL